MPPETQPTDGFDPAQARPESRDPAIARRVSSWARIGPVDRPCDYARRVAKQSLQ